MSFLLRLRRRAPQARTILSASILWLAFGPAASADELLRIDTRPGVTESMSLWDLPGQAAAQTLILLMPGGPGHLGLQMKDGRVESDEPYLFSEQPDALAQGRFAVAVLDAPSDHDDMTQAFRASPEHATDLQAVVRSLRTRFPKAKLVLVAHSRGTVSAGHLAQSLGKELSAVVLVSGLYQETPAGASAPSSGPGLSKIDLPGLKVPLLLVQHAQDACPVSPLAPATALSKRVPTIVVNGLVSAATTTADREAPCGPRSSHWLAGREREVGREIANWLSGKPWKRSVP